MNSRQPWVLIDHDDKHLDLLCLICGQAERNRLEAYVDGGVRATPGLIIRFQEDHHSCGDAACSGPPRLQFFLLALAGFDYDARLKADGAWGSDGQRWDWITDTLLRVRRATLSETGGNA